MKKPHILLVEDEAILFDRLRNRLSEKEYSVSDYTPSVEEALKSIERKRPDLALLDINLQGEYSGLDLGKILDRDFNIPLIYVTERNDDESFYEGLYGSNHNDFIVKVNNKIDIDGLLRKITTVLYNNRKIVEKFEPKGAINVYVDYIDETKNLGKDDIAEVVLAYKDIACFTTNSNEVIHQDQKTGRKKYKKMRRNNARVLTFLDEKFYIAPNNLTVIDQVSPNWFVRISDDYIVNIHHAHFNGRINGSRIMISGEEFVISENFKARFDSFYKELYQSIKKGDLK